MAAITERCGRYQARVRRDGFKTVTKTFIRKGDALAWGRRVEADMEAGRWIEDSQRVPTLGQAVDLYITAVGHKLKGATTYTYRYKQIKAEAFASKPVDEVTARDLAEWRDRQAATLKASTVVRTLALLSSVFTWAIKERGWGTVNPLSLVAKPRVTDGRTRTLSPKELDALTAAATTSKAAWLADALIVLTRTAMRRGELVGLRRRDVDYSACIAHLSDTKAGVPRDVPLCPRALAALRRLDEAAAARGDVALLPLTTAGSLSTRFIKTVARARAQYERDCAAAGVSPEAGFLADVRCHDMRHHAVTTWAEAGLGLVELMAVSGHTTMKMMSRYTHLNRSALAGKMATLNT